MMRWQDIKPEDAVNINLAERLDITAPLNEVGERCPWPWEPQQLKGAPLGQYHCQFCLAMVIAGLEHPDYGETVHMRVCACGNGPLDDSETFCSECKE